jgi:acetyltransferase-like isoleucine patch superfamily enzyme
MNTNSITANRSRLIYRRQFFLGPRCFGGFPHWKQIEIRKAIRITAHPDLNVEFIQEGNRSITLLGFMLDPHRPAWTDRDILAALFLVFANCANRDNIFEFTYDFGGRWVIVYDDGIQVTLFTDPAGYRQVYYTDAKTIAPVYCASQPGTIAASLGLLPDDEALEFIAKVRARGIKEYWWPGETSLYREVRHLLPNHYLDLLTGACQRFWPCADLEKKSFADSVFVGSQILNGLIESASKRYDLALTLTAGRDSRLILSLLNQVKDEIYYYTGLYWHLDEKSADITIASELLATFGKKNNIIRCPQEMDAVFSDLYFDNVETARDVYGTIAQGLFADFPQNRVCMKGNCVPIIKSGLRNKLRKKGKPDDHFIQAEDLAELVPLGHLPFTVKAYDHWLEKLGNTYNYDILDLFWWEEREGNWQAMSQLEWDLIHDIFVPFNCRTFLMNALSVDQERRMAPTFDYHQEMIRQNWPQLLSIPINPHKKILEDTHIRPSRKILNKIKLKRNVHKLWWIFLPAMQFSSLPVVGRWLSYFAGLFLGPYRGKKLLATITTKPYVSHKTQIDCNDLSIGKNCFIDDYVTIVSGTKGGSVELKNKVHLFRGTIIEVNRKARVIIGADTQVQAYCIINALLNSILIGSNVMIGQNCGFYSYQHRKDDLTQYLCKQGFTSKGDIIIGDNVWLGAGVKVMDGVKIGSGSVIGANSVVTKNIPSYSIAVGVPAKVIRKRKQKGLSGVYEFQTTS